MKDERNLIISEIKAAHNSLGALRREEQHVRQHEDYVLQSNESDTDLLSILKKVLPANLVPSNMGDFKDVSYPTWYELEFDFSNGVDTVFDPLNLITKFFTIGQEHGFLLSNISRAYNNNDFAGEGAPLEVTFRNAASSRQFNDNPILIQHFASRGKQTPFTVPMFIHPNSKLEVTMKSWYPNTYTIANTSGIQRLVFSGRRVDMNSLKTLSQRVFR